VDGSQASLDSSKIYKIKYSINLLPLIGAHVAIEENADGYLVKQLLNDQVGERQVGWMDLIQQSDELGIFASKAMKPLVEFKWSRYGKRHHAVGFFMHVLQVAIMTVYVKLIHIDNMLQDCPQGCSNPYAFSLLAGVLYAAVYELIQLGRIGPRQYFTDFQNYLDILYCSFGAAVAYYHYVHLPFVLASKLVMITSILLSTARTFKYMRIFQDCSPIVVMLGNVGWDLRIFLLFYAILIAFFSMVMDVTGFGNTNAQLN